MKRIAASFFLLMSMGGFAQAELDSVASIANPEIEKHQAKIAEYQATLAGLEEKVIGLRADADHKKEVAEASSADNKHAAAKLNDDLTSRRKARRARNAGDQAADDAKQARKADSRLKDTERDIEKLKSKIRKEEKKIEKLKEG